MEIKFNILIICKVFFLSVKTTKYFIIKECVSGVKFECC
jgi:hypothetical protein